MRPKALAACVTPNTTLAVSWLANAASTIFTDIIILCLPIPPIWKLQLGKSEKLGLTAAFAIGSFVVFASAYRTSVLFTYSDKDPSYTLAPTVGWTEIEMSAGIVSANLPTMLPVLRIVAKFTGLSSFASTIRSNGQSKGDQSTKGLKSHENNNGGRSANSNSVSSNNFYRLSDDNDSDTPIKGAQYTESSVPVDARLRPDIEGFELTTKTYNARVDGNTSDEEMLQGIRVHREFHQSSTQK